MTRPVAATAPISGFYSPGRPPGDSGARCHPGGARKPRPSRQRSASTRVPSPRPRCLTQHREQPTRRSAATHTDSNIKSPLPPTLTTKARSMATQMMPATTTSASKSSFDAIFDGIPMSVNQSVRCRRRGWGSRCRRCCRRRRRHRHRPTSRLLASTPSAHRPVPHRRHIAPRHYERRQLWLQPEQRGQKLVGARA